MVAPKKIGSTIPAAAAQTLFHAKASISSPCTTMDYLSSETTIQKV
jgi:hypothetical protein